MSKKCKCPKCNAVIHYNPSLGRFARCFECNGLTDTTKAKRVAHARRINRSAR